MNSNLVIIEHKKKPYYQINYGEVFMSPKYGKISFVKIPPQIRQGKAYGAVRLFGHKDGFIDEKDCYFFFDEAENVYPAEKVTIVY